ncbi:hypothetical protein [Streptomyces antimycoticus]|uniref:hypothetical protein n=1 Tax=Streptomyces antimycoticus TaxID=68175 RepID=UPI0036CF936E
MRGAGGTDSWRKLSVRLPRTVTGSHDVSLVATGGHRVAAVDWLTLRQASWTRQTY